MEEQKDIDKQNLISSNLYADISLDSLLTYCVYLVCDEKKEATFEDIVVKCFKLFPEKFSLVGYPNYPDSARVNKSWLRCRTDFKYITGTVKTGFNITTKGLIAVQQVQKKLKRSKSETQKSYLVSANARSKEEKILREIERSEVFKKYKLYLEKTEISQWEFCDLLFCTLESSPNVLKENLELLKGYAEKLGKTQILEFLNYLGEKYSRYLEGSNTVESYRGGMNKKRVQ